MAYVYNQGQDDEAAGNVATNIFQANTQGQGGPAPAQATGSGDQSASVTTGGNSGTAQQAKTQAPQGASSSKEVIRRNADKAQSPIDVSGIRANISQAKSDLQNEANSYVASQEKEATPYTAGDVQAALRGQDQAKLQGIQQRLTQATPQYKEFAPTTNTDFSSKINELNDSSLRNYFKNAGGPTATLGDAAFDAMLLGKNKQFKQDRATAQQEAAQFGEEAKKTITAKNEEAQKAYADAYERGNKSIREAAQAEMAPILSKAQGKAAADEAERQKYAGMSARDLMKNASGYQDFLNNVANELTSNQEYRNYLQGAINNRMGNVLPAVDPTMNFINVSQAPITASNYLTQEQAAELNRGNQLLGLGGPSYAAAGAASPVYSFNKNAASAYLQNLLSSRQAEQQAQAQQKAEAEARAEADRQAAAAGDAAAAARERARKEANRQENYETMATGGASAQAKAAAQKGKEALNEGAKRAGTVICTEYYRRGWIARTVYDACQAYGSRVLHPETKQNYLAWATGFVKILQAVPILCYLFWPIFSRWFYYMAWHMGARKKKPFLGRFVFETLCMPVSNGVGSALRRRSRWMEVT